MTIRPFGVFALAAAFSGAPLSQAQPEPPAPPDLPVAPEPTPAPSPVPQKPSGPIEVNGIVGRVNGRIITKNQVGFMLAPIYAQLAAQFPRRGPEFERQFLEAQDKVIQEMVDRQLILDEFKRMGASIKPHFIDDEIKRQLRENYNGNEAKFRDELKRSRMTMEGYREMTKEKLIVQAMRQQKFADAPPPLPNEINREYAEIKTSLRDTSKDRISFQKIFIPRLDQQNPGSTPESQLTLAESIGTQLAEGKDFSELAKTYSKDAFAEQGGVQEDVPRIDLAPEFAAIIFDGPEGKVVGPLEDPQGFTLVKVTKKNLGPSPALQGEIRQQVEERVRRKKTSVQYDRWMEGLRKKAIIDIRK
jgi:peptidyl-prolyl cis-trans isomerase SurA